MNADDDFFTPITTQPEDFFDVLREQTEATRLAEGLLRYTNLPVVPADDPGELDDLSLPRTE